MSDIVIKNGGPPDAPVRLKRQLGLIHGVAIICGLVVGSGIWVSPRGVLANTQNMGLSLVLWIVGGFVATLGALSIAELGTTFPASGEKYAYLEKMFGKFVAFLYMWTYMMMFRCGSNAIKCLAFANYILKPLYPDCPIPGMAVSLIAVLLACELI